MIRNLTGHTVRLYDPETPDEIDDPDTGLLATLEPVDADHPARIAPAGVGTADDVWHHHRRFRVGLVAYREVENLPAPDRQHATHLLVDLEVGLVAGGRADLLVPRTPVRDPDGNILGYRHLTSPC